MTKRMTRAALRLQWKEDESGKGASCTLPMGEGQRPLEVGVLWCRAWRPTSFLGLVQLPGLAEGFSDTLVRVERPTLLQAQYAVEEELESLANGILAALAGVQR